MSAYDPDVVAYLFPVEGKGRKGALRTMDITENAVHLVPAQNQNDSPRLTEALDRTVRQPTEQPEEKDSETSDPYFKFTFSNLPKSSLGYVAGRAPQSDLLLVEYKGVSWYHFALTFNDKNELVVKDLNSTVGTRVIYDDEEGQRGYGIAWSARGPSLMKGKAPTIKITGDLMFRIVVPAHDKSSKTFLENITRFRQGSAAPEDLFRDLRFQRVKTELATPTNGAYTQGAGTSNPLFWKRKLGQGVFATVHFVFNVTTEEEYALKEPLTKRFDLEAWRKEYQMMKGICHDHIVKLEHASFEDGPKLYFDYVPGGSLEGYLSTTTPFHNKQIAVQLLSGLKHLHAQEVPIAHRDIKPENILVQTWSPTDVFVKFADFGLSKQAEVLKTYCGTLIYAAPEIYCLPSEPMYSPLVDIWSLGVLLAQLECGRLPECLVEYANRGTFWAETIVQFVQAYTKRHGESKLLSLVRENMLVIEAQNRRTAVACHITALELLRQEPCDVAIASVEETSFHITDSSALHSEEKDCDKKGSLSTPKAAPMDAAAASQDFGASIIASLGWRGSDAVDGLLGMAASDMSEFQRSAGVSAETARVVSSLVEGGLWAEPLEGNKRAGEEDAEWQASQTAEGECEEDGSSKTVLVRQTLCPSDSYYARAILSGLADPVIEGADVGQMPSKRHVVEDGLSRKRTRLQQN